MTSATDELLAELRSRRWTAGAWWRLLTSSVHRSWRQARARPAAALQVTALHVLFHALGHGGRAWTATSWAMAITHLGLLGDRRSLSPADVVTLTRANLPALAPHAPRLLGPLAQASDLLDGHLARATATTSPFGHYADALADAVFWTWFALRHEPNRAVRAAAIAAWPLPVALITAASVARGRMVQPPRPRVLRPAAALQALLTVRALAGRQGGAAAAGSPS